MLAAFAFGAVYALSPGHGKTLVAVYLVGSRGTPRHVVFLGLMVTFTHTVSVFALGLVMGAISGITIVWVGGTLLYRRTMGSARGRFPRTSPTITATARCKPIQPGRPDRTGRERRPGSLPFRAGAAALFGLARSRRAGPNHGLTG